jgi:hypothetical protein
MTIPVGISNYDTLAASGITLSQAAFDATPMTPDSPITPGKVNAPNNKHKPKRKKLHKLSNPLDTVAIPEPPSSKECPIPPAFTDTSLWKKIPGPLLQGKFDSPPSGDSPRSPEESNVIVIPPPPGSTVRSRTSSSTPQDSLQTQPNVIVSNPVASPRHHDKLKDVVVEQNVVAATDKNKQVEKDRNDESVSNELIVKDNSGGSDSRTISDDFSVMGAPDTSKNQLETASSIDASLLQPTVSSRAEEVARRRAYFAQRVAESRQRALESSQRFKHRTNESVSKIQ